MLVLAVGGGAWTGCARDPGGEVDQQDLSSLVRAVPNADGTALVIDDGVPNKTIRVSQAVYDAFGDRWRPSDPGPPYNNQNDPWKLTDDQRTAAAAGDLRDTLTRMMCGADADLTYCQPLDNTGPCAAPRSDGDYTYRDLGTCEGFHVAVWTGDADDTDAILVGRPSDFDYSTSPFLALTRFNREQNLVRSVNSGDTLLLLGAEGAGVEMAVGSLLRSAGYRWYLPTPTWEVVPDYSLGDLQTALEIDVLDGPARGLDEGLLTRKLALLPDVEDRFDFQAWQLRNGFGGSFQVTAVQGTWTRIYQSDPWFASPGVVSDSSDPILTGGSTNRVKFCPEYTDGLGETVAQHIYSSWVANKLLITDPTQYNVDVQRDVVPLHHHDSAYWEGCGDHSTPADRSLRLANEVVTAAGGAFGDRYVSVYGYREPFAGPLAEVPGPNLFVWLLGTGFRGTPFDDAVAAWRAGPTDPELGYYLYWNVQGRELPTDDEVQAVEAVSQRMVDRVDDGFVSLWIEASGGWGQVGLWRWIALEVARSPDVALAEDVATAVEVLREDFEVHAFPVGARPFVHDYFDLLDASHQQILLSPDYLAEMYAALDGAYDQSVGDDPARARVEDLLTYARHVELAWKFDQTQAQADYEAYIEHAVCAGERLMVDYDYLWAHDPTEKAQYLLDHGNQTPEQVVGASCPATGAPEFDDWITNAPTGELGSIQWYAGAEGTYGRPAGGLPGDTLSAGTYEWYLHGFPRDAVLWKVWVDPDVGVDIEESCYGVLGTEFANPAQSHLTSRLYGQARLKLRVPGDPDQVLCEVVYPPHKDGRSIHLSSAGATVTDPNTSANFGLGKFCNAAPRALTLDTGVVDTGTYASCTSAFTTAGIYELVSENHREGLDPGRLAGDEVYASKWETPFTPFDDRSYDAGQQSRYFYVPAGTTQLAIWNNGGLCTVHLDAGTTEELGDGFPHYHVLDATGRDGTVWAMEHCSKAYLVNIPPVVAPDQDQLLVSCEFYAGSPADQGKFSLKTGDCPP